jgi:hypothetical protein
MSPGWTDLKWSGREGLNLRPPGPELQIYKLQVAYLVSLREQHTSFSLAQLYRSCTERVYGRQTRDDGRFARIGDVGQRQRSAITSSAFSHKMFAQISPCVAGPAYKIDVGF